MKKQLLLLISFFFFFFVSFSQETIQKYKGKTYIFDSYEQVTECDPLGGNTVGTSTIVLKGSLFTIVRVPDSTHLVIKFLEWNKKDSAKREQFNFSKDKSTAIKTEKFFLLEKRVFDRSCSEYTIQQKWDITFGTLTTPFKFRYDPFLFTSNLNLGTSISFQRRFYTNWSWGIVGGLSLSSVTLDSFSTKGYVKTSTERPAVTPSLSLMIGYKNVNVTLGVGWDFINKTSTVEQSWLYHGKRWIGLGIGVNLFNSTSSAPQTKPEQKKQH